LVSRLEKVRTLYTLRDDDGDMVTPFAVSQKIEISSVLKISDAWITFDAKLATIRDATYGPDYPRTSVDPQTVRIIIEEAASMGVARDDARDLIVDASQDVPENSPADDRRRITLGARLINFIRATGRFIWTHRGKIKFATGTTVTGLGIAIIFINKNAVLLSYMFDSSPTLVKIIEWIGQFTL
jgi:hypothetical protein